MFKKAMAFFPSISFKLSILYCPYEPERVFETLVIFTVISFLASRNDIIFMSTDKVKGPDFVDDKSLSLKVTFFFEILELDGPNYFGLNL